MNESTRSGVLTSLGAGQKIGLAAGPIVFLVFLLSPTPEGLSPAGWHTAGVGLLMAIWWITEALPVPATALLPIVLFPFLGIVSIGDATAPYANPLIFLFMGGFMIAIGMETWELHRRIALSIIRFIGTRPSSIIFGFMLSSAFLSMWISNTSTALMMLPIAISIIDLLRRKGVIGRPGQRANFEVVLMLSVAYGCNIGGMGTLIGTPPNALLAGFLLDNYGFEVGFLQWMMVGVPLATAALPLSFLLLTRVLYPLQLAPFEGGKALIDGELRKLGRPSPAERRVAAVFCLVAALWITRPILATWMGGLSDTGIAVMGGLLLFLIPSGMQEQPFLLDWAAVRKLPWGVLILFGGGLSLASAISSTGLAEWIGGGLGAFSDWPTLMLVVLAVTIIIFLTEITSNMATTAAFLPIIASVAIGAGQNPLLLAVPAVFAASSAFMLPVATPPNAIVYGTGHVSIPEMAKAGIWLNVLLTVLITAFSYLLLGVVFGVEIGVLPSWAQ